MVDIPANTATTAVLDGFGTQFIDLGTLSGLLETSGDRDWIRVELKAGQTYHFYLSFLETGSPAASDSFLALRDANGNFVIGDDDSGVGLNSLLTFTPAVAGTYFLDVGAIGPAIGEYSLTAAAPFGSTNKLLSDANDIYTGLAGERIVGGKGADTIALGAAKDALGEQGNDIIAGNGLPNFISGGLGHDTIDGAGLNDILFGDAGNDEILGGNELDFLNGGEGNDVLSGGAGSDTLLGGAGSDFLDGGPSEDFLLGGPGADILSGGDDADRFQIAGSEGLGDTFAGGAGTDTLAVQGSAAVTLSGFNAASSSIEAWVGNGKGLLGTAGANTFDFAGLAAMTALPFVDGLGGNDTLIGSKFADDLRGGLGNDTLSGGAGKDVLRGGAGRDTLTGGAEADRFDFNSIKETVKGANRDTIQDFSRGGGDRIDLSTIDAKTGIAGNNAFKFIGAQDFHDKKGELHYVMKSGFVYVEGDRNGDGDADFQIKVKGVGGLDAGDFLL